MQPARALVTEGGWVSATYQPLEPAPRPLSAGAAPGVAVAAWGAAAVSPVPLSPRAPATGLWRPVCGTEVAPSLPWITQEARIQQTVKFFGTRRELS